MPRSNPGKGTAVSRLFYQPRGITMKRHSKHTLALLLQLALLIWLGSACATSKNAPAVDITGNWQASVQIPEGDFEVTMHIRQSTGGILSATMDVPGMDAYDIPLVFDFENDVVRWEIEEAGYSYNGKLTDPSTIEGSSSQPDGTRSLVFKRVE